MTTISKKQNLTKFFDKNKPVESTDYETGLPDATLTEVQAKILMKVWVLKLKSVNSKMSRSQSFLISARYKSFCGSLMIPITTGPDIAGKTKFVTGKKLKRESPVYHNKTKSET